MKQIKLTKKQIIRIIIGIIIAIGSVFSYKISIEEPIIPMEQTSTMVDSTMVDSTMIADSTLQIK